VNWLTTSISPTSEKRELADHQYLAPNVPYRKVEFAVIVTEDAKVSCFICKVLGILAIIGGSHTQQNHEAGSNSAHHPPLHTDRSLQDPLQKRFH